jgi:hypothetical protein
LRWLRETPKDFPVARAVVDAVCEELAVAELVSSGSA